MDSIHPLVVPFSPSFFIQTQTTLLDAIRCKSQDGYPETRARIHLRKGGGPTDDTAVRAEVEKSRANLKAARSADKKITRTEQKREKRKRGGVPMPGPMAWCTYPDVTSEAIQDAIISGEEVSSGFCSRFSPV